MSIASPSVAFENVSVILQKNTLLSCINLNIEARNWFGIVGPNGGGKSTLIKALAGLIPHRGNIYLKWPQQKPGNIGYMPQRVPADESLPITVSDYLGMCCQKRPIWLGRTEHPALNEAIASLELFDLLDKKLGTLSAGERQRTMLCAALANKPQLLLLDEPFAGIDSPGKTKVLSALQQFHQSGGTIIMVEHHWDIIRDYCQKVAWVDNKLKLVASPQEVMHKLNRELSPFETRDSQGKHV